MNKQKILTAFITQRDYKTQEYYIYDLSRFLL